MGKMNSSKSGKGFTGGKSQGLSRKLTRKMKRKNEKINKALNYAKSKNTNKVCVSKDDMEFIKTVQNKTNANESPICNNITSALKGKILSNNKNINNCNNQRKPNNKHSKKISKNKSKNLKKKENNPKKEESSFKMSENSNERLSKLQEYVNKESLKMKNEEKNNSKMHKNVNCNGLIKDKQKLKDLLEEQNKDQKLVNKYARKLRFTSHQKNKIHPDFEEDFGSILRDIEDGNFENYKHEVQKTSNSVDNFENDIIASIGKKCSTDKDVCRKSKSKNSNLEQNGINKNCVNGNLSESDEDIDSDEEIEKKFGDKFIDDEAEEGSDENDDDKPLNDNEEDIMFESGSCLASSEYSVRNRPPTINSIFDLYEKKLREEEEEEEEEDSDLDGFIVDDDYIEYSDEAEEPVLENRKRKKSRIINRELHSENVLSDIEVDEAKKDCSKNFKRRRILSESESDEIESPVKKRLHNLKRFQEKESFGSASDTTICKNSILKKNSSGNSKNSKSEKRVSFSLPEETKEYSSNTEKIENYHEDIYGRLRDKDGNIVKIDNDELEDNGKYMPPAMRKLMALNNSSNKKEQLAQLKKKLKGQLNRLAESNMAGILSQFETYFHSNSRNDMNDTLTNLLFETLVTPVMTPERLIQDHAFLVSVLSANVENEVGAYILSKFVLKWLDDLENFKPSSNVDEIDSKELDNMLMFICQLYNFKVVDSLLIYNILHKILERNLNDKEAELILLILKSVGFNLRKDDPLALKSLISEVNLKASEISSSHSKDDSFSRVKFMLEILTAIRNNNMSKVPNYDPSHSLHLKSLMKGFIRKGCRTSEMKVSLDDLVKSKLVGKWWIVGAPWSSGLKERNESLNEIKGHPSPESEVKSYEGYSEIFMKKAAKLHITRPPRLNILYILTEGAENFEDSFEKLIELKIPSNQQQEIFRVMLLCCVRSKVYNEFYNHLAHKLIKFKKSFQRLLQFTLWDKFKELDNMKPSHCSNLAKFVSNLIAEDGFTMAVFKNINFAETGEGTISFFRQALLGIFLHPSGNYVVSKVFENLCGDSKLKSLRLCVRLFIIQFIKPHKTEDKNINKLLKSRVEIALDLLESVIGVAL